VNPDISIRVSKLRDAVAEKHRVGWILVMRGRTRGRRAWRGSRGGIVRLLKRTEMEMEMEWVSKQFNKGE
jgi:hypothetical protein